MHLSIDKSNRWIFVANLHTGTVAVIPRSEQGFLMEVKELYTIPGIEKDTVSHPHQVLISPDQNYLIVSCQGRTAGYGQVDVFRIDHSYGKLHKTCSVRSREIAEPRHITFAGTSEVCYGVNEKDYTITSYRFDTQKGTLQPFQVISTLPDYCISDGWSSGIIANDTNRYIVISNRRDNSISSFVIEPNGSLKLAGYCKTDGLEPRFITIDSTNGNILVANKESHNLREFILNPESGELIRTDFMLETGSPSCVLFRAT